ncbi:MAG: hypothetical protein ACREX4_18770 [Gammaproteobacteria bacterium]
MAGFYSDRVVAVAGSSRLPPGGAELVARVARALEASGCSLVVGGCAGADQAALSAASAVRVLCAFGPGGAGAGPASAVRAVLAAQASGVPVAWWAGGSPSVPLKARLARRTAAVVAEASAGCVVFPFSPVVTGSGSWLAASPWRAAAGGCLPGVVSRLRAATAREYGQWGPTGSGVWSGAW